MNSNKGIIYDLNRSIIKWAISIVILLGFRLLISLLTFLKGVSFFDTPLSFSDFIIGVIYGIMVFLTVRFAFYLKREYEIVDFPAAINIIKWMLFLIVTIIAYKLFFPFAYTLLDNEITNYNITFLIIILIILTKLIVLIFSKMEEITDLFTGRIKIKLRKPIPGPEIEIPQEPNLGEDADGASKKRCPNPSCNQTISDEAKFCRSCGTKIR